MEIQFGNNWACYRNPIGTSETKWEPQGKPLKSNVEKQWASNGTLWKSIGNRKGTRGESHVTPMEIPRGPRGHPNEKPKEIKWAPQGDPMAIP